MPTYYNFSLLFYNPLHGIIMEIFHHNKSSDDQMLIVFLVNQGARNIWHHEWLYRIINLKIKSILSHLISANLIFKGIVRFRFPFRWTSQALLACIWVIIVFYIQYIRHFSHEPHNYLKFKKEICIYIWLHEIPSYFWEGQNLKFLFVSQGKTHTGSKMGLVPWACFMGYMDFLWPSRAI